MNSYCAISDALALLLDEVMSLSDLLTDGQSNKVKIAIEKAFIDGLGKHYQATKKNLKRKYFTEIEFKINANLVSN